LLPEVTVVIPTRDRVHRLPSALETALRQEEVVIEVVAVDDGSSDGTHELLSEWPDERVRVLRRSPGRGVAAARNAAIAAARGDWIAFLDDDDRWAPTKLRRQLDAAAAAQASFVYAAAVVVDEAGSILHHNPAPPADDVARELLVRNAVPGGCSNAMARTALVRAVGGFDENLSHLADWDLWIRLAVAGRAATCPDVLVAYVRHATNMVATSEPDFIREFQYLRAKHAEAAHAAGVRLDRVRLYRYFGRGQRRAGRLAGAARLYARLALEERSAVDLARAVACALGPRAVAVGRELRRRARRRTAAPPTELELELPWLVAGGATPQPARSGAAAGSLGPIIVDDGFAAH
jgi:glycosyltransferase involved in cell wall biosynthesis